MVGFVEGFVVPVAKGRREEYRRYSEAVAAVYLEHGATRLVECWSDALGWGKRTSFPRAVECTEGEAVVFAWIEFPDEATRDACHAKVWADPRTEALRFPEMIDGKRMVFGGFSVLVDAR